jgi:hypothetical protein
MTELKSNLYEDDDMRQVIGEYEGFDDEAEKIMASARGKVQGLRKKQKNLKKRAKDDLGIPSKLFSTLIKQRKLERQLQKLADDVPEDEVELYADASGQFSWLAPVEDEPPTVTPAQRAARKAAAAAAEHHEQEQADGAAALSELATVN